MSFRNLTKEEIDRLVSQHCYSNDWNGILVKEGFLTDNIIQTRFEGQVKLGKFSGKIEIEKGITRKCGIYNSRISNCEIEDQVYISDVKDLLNYNIRQDVVIFNASSLVVNCESSFGNGTEIEILNEGGGRELPIFDRLSSQIAYFAVLYRHDKEFIQKLLKIIKDYCKSKSSDRGVIESGTRIYNTGRISNVNIGGYSTIAGTSLLEEGTIKSCREAPVYIGEGVIAKKFIVLSGSKIDSGAIIEKCFVGQGVKIGKQFSAENSAFFANCEAFHGEACSLFAGPYTVTHHKSTLLIACYVSFFNAGSGTNQSNHMYKLGPLHQGIMERGSKTGSSSYLLQPFHIGPYSVIIGKHYSNFDTSDFPFSYIVEEKGRSVLVPGINLFKVGTRRDADKWPARDRRTDPYKTDLIHFHFLNPYTVGKVTSAIKILNDLDKKTDKNLDYTVYKGINLSKQRIRTSKLHYEMILKVFMGQEVVKRICDIGLNSKLSDLISKLGSDDIEGNEKWVDICGLFSPEIKINELIDSVKNNRISTIEGISGFLARISENYEKYSWGWCSELIKSQYGYDPVNNPVNLLIQIITEWKTSTLKLNYLILEDAVKEFDAETRTGFGIDGGDEVKNMDFEAVRGNFNDNKFVISLRNESKEIEEKADRFIMILQNLQKSKQ